jgi:hypothetical protein
MSSTTTKILTTAIVSAAVGTLSYFKGNFDAAEYNNSYLEIEKNWRLLWDKQIVFLRQLLVGRTRDSSSAYNVLYLEKLRINIVEMNNNLVTNLTATTTSQIQIFTDNLQLYVGVHDNIFTTTIASGSSPDPASVLELNNIDTAMATALSNIDNKLFNFDEAYALFSDFTVRILRMGEFERISNIDESMTVYQELQKYSINMADYFARAINVNKYPIRKWI